MRWHVPLPGPCNSSPIVWGDRVFVTQAMDGGARRTVMCFHRADGKLLWQSGVPYREKEQTQPNNPYFYELKGQALLENGKANEAIAPLRRAAQLAPQPALIQIMLGQALVATENPQWS